MLSRRTLLAASGSLVLLGCPRRRELPSATSFLKNIQVLDRNGKLLPDVWSISQTNPIDPTIQFETVAPPSVLGNRKVLPADQWIITVDVRDESDNSRWSAQFRGKNRFAEETVGNQQGELVWESPDAPKSLAEGVVWQWCHCRVSEAGRFTLVFRLYPTSFRLPSSPQIDYGEGIEIARQNLIVEAGSKSEFSFTMSIMNAELNRTMYRKLRKNKK